jgi:hypothetical protein
LIPHREGRRREEGRGKRREAGCDVCVCVCVCVCMYVCVKWEDLGDRINPRNIRI